MPAASQYTRFMQALPTYGLFYAGMDSEVHANLGPESKV